jgi:hypothetical protein
VCVGTSLTGVSCDTAPGVAVKCQCQRDTSLGANWRITQVVTKKQRGRLMYALLRRHQRRALVRPASA